MDGWGEEDGGGNGKQSRGTLEPHVEESKGHDAKKKTQHGTQEDQDQETTDSGHKIKREK
jgi:hypothetical protein